MLIESAQNQYIKYLVKLHEKRERKETGRFVVEGEKMVLEGLESGWRYDTLIIAPELLKRRTDFWRGVAGERKVRLVEINAICYNKITTFETPPGVALEMRQKNWDKNIPSAPENTTVLVCAHLQDPGNFGTALRVADAAGLDAVILVEPSVDPYNPKSVRASMGSLFRMPVVRLSHDFLKYVDDNQLELIATVADGGVSYREAKWPKRAAIMIGSESSGLDEELLAKAKMKVSIPIRGGAESLNAGVAAGILVFEAIGKK